MHHPKLHIHYVLCMPWEREGYNDEDGLVISEPRRPLYSCLSLFIGLCSKLEQGLSLCLRDLKLKQSRLGFLLLFFCPEKRWNWKTRNAFLPVFPLI